MALLEVLRVQKRTHGLASTLRLAVRQYPLLPRGQRTPCLSALLLATSLHATQQTYTPPGRKHALPDAPKELLKLEESEWIRAVRGYVFQNGYMVVFIAFDLMASREDATAANFNDLATWTVVPSSSSTGDIWPQASTFAIEGTTGWGKGLIVLYQRAYSPLIILMKDTMMQWT